MSWHRTTVRPIVARGIRSYRARCECGWVSGARYQLTGDAALDGVAHQQGATLADAGVGARIAALVHRHGSDH
jgi:hypothetical protein